MPRTENPFSQCEDTHEQEPVVVSLGQWGGWRDEEGATSSRSKWESNSECRHFL